MKRGIQAAALIALAALLMWALCACASGRARTAELSRGDAYLRSLEQQDPDTVAQILRSRRLEQLRAEREARIQALMDARENVWQEFRDYAILGDSRAIGFYYFDFLEKSRVLADGGETIANVPDHLEELHTLNPAYIYLCYGVNDVGIGYWKTAEDYADAYADTVRMLASEFPDAVIVVSSLLPAQEAAFRVGPAWRNIPDYSHAVQAWCAENGVAFADNDEIAAEHANLYQPDGVHLQPEFYPYWGVNLILASWGEGDVDEA